MLLAKYARLCLSTLRLVSLTLAAVLLVTPVPSRADEEIQLKVVTSWAKDHPIVSALLQGFRDRQSELNGVKLDHDAVAPDEVSSENLSDHLIKRILSGNAQITVFAPRIDRGFLSTYPHFEVVELPNLASNSTIGSLALLETIRKTEMSIKFPFEDETRARDLQVLAVFVTYPAALHLRYEIANYSDLEAMRILTIDRLSADSLRFIGIQAIIDNYGYIREEAQRRAADALALDWEALFFMEVGNEYRYHLDLQLGSIAVIVVIDGKSLERMGLDPQGKQFKGKLDLAKELTEAIAKSYDTYYASRRSEQIKTGGQPIDLPPDLQDKLEAAYANWGEVSEEHSKVLKAYREQFNKPPEK